MSPDLLWRSTFLHIITHGDTHTHTWNCWELDVPDVAVPDMDGMHSEKLFYLKHKKEGIRVDAKLTCSKAKYLENGSHIKHLRLVT